MKYHYRAVYSPCLHEDVKVEDISQKLISNSYNIKEGLGDGCIRQRPCEQCGLLSNETYYLTPIGVLRVE